MIEVLDVPARHMKGTSAAGVNYDFYIQKARVSSVDRDGIETTEVIEVQSDPGEVYAPADDYIVDPSCYYVSNVPDKKGYARKRLLVPQAVRLVRMSDLVAQFAKPALKAA